jgi:hypothetical protein
MPVVRKDGPVADEQHIRELDEFVHKIIKRLSIQGRKKSPDNT